MRTSAFLSLALVAIACASTPLVPRPTAAEIEASDCGERPDEDVAKSFAEFWILSKLKDPESARIEWSAIHRSTFRKSGTNDLYQFAWELTAFVNAKNSFGGYTGSKPWHFFFRGDSLVGLGQPGRYGMTYVDTELDARTIKDMLDAAESGE